MTVEQSVLVQKKFKEYRDWNFNWAYRSYEDAKRWNGLSGDVN